jgi:uncharacterized membrane protein YedE/YeeE
MELLNTIFPNGMSHYLFGGLLIGLGTGLLFLFTGLVGGMSSIYSAVWSFCSRVPFFQEDKLTKTRKWRLVYAAGLILGAAIWLGLPGTEMTITSVPLWQLAVGGFIAGFGARLGSGCTSGHGICGVASLSLPSVLAVLVFLGVAIVTAQLVASLGL